jgi:hypothetical protein
VFDLAALDVALGLVFVYLVLSLVCTAINETVSSVLAWRADTLREGIANLLGGEDERMQLYRHPLVAGLIRRGGARWRRVPLARRLPIMREERYPSYIPARVFAMAVLNPVEGDGPVTKKDVAAVIEAIPSQDVRQALQVLWNDADENVARFRASLETWYDEAMSRVSGWYRRRIQFWLWVWALAVAVGLHADTLQIARTLWTDDATRAVVVARAERTAQAPLTEASVETAAQSVTELKELEIPLGWSGPFPQGDWQHDLWVVLLNALGLGLTAVALTLGAPFWFDLLKKVANIRSAGKAPAERPVEKPAEAGEPTVEERGG